MPMKEADTPSILVLRQFFATHTREEKLEVFDRVRYADGRPDDAKVSEAGIMRALRKRGLVKEQIRADWTCDDLVFEQTYARSRAEPMAVTVGAESGSPG